MNEKVEKIVKKLKNPKMLIICGLTGIALIALSSFFPLSGSDKADAGTASQEMSVKEYESDLEERVKKIVSDITGSDNVTVMITLESSVKYVYADDTKDTSSTVSGDKSTTQSSANSKSYITVKSSEGGDKALVVTQNMPQVRGVAVICDGGDDIQLSEKINNAVCAALNITSKRVYIAGGR